MNNFTYHNPTRIVFGKGMIREISNLIPAGSRVLLTYGGGSIKRNGVHAQVMKALAGCQVEEFGGIEPNPRYETLMKAVAQARKFNAGLLLAVGGGSVLDGTKFIAAAVRFEGGDPWDILARDKPVRNPLPIGCVMTLPATGSEMNCYAVVSRDSTQEKLAFANPLVYPQFSILDPETTYSLPRKQVANGIVDAFVHVMEQYMTYPSAAPLQDRQSEAVLRTLIEEAPRILADPPDYDARAAFMWCATNGLNGWLACGVPQDWATHMIGHEITALHGLDHAQTLAIVLPAVWKHEKERKKAKLLQYASRVWSLDSGDEDSRIAQVIEKTAAFFRSVGLPTSLHDYQLPPEIAKTVAGRLSRRGAKLGEHEAISGKEVEEILRLAY
ncbi:MAG: iron-containing alcohol dehydrogenase [Verrucomicrobiae bacterium]|nr:iron-containing alcohol dehydrogenase [Verrucomicrobiae bacterium]